MRWSDATIHVALQIMASSSPKLIQRLRDSNIINLPSVPTMQLKRFRFRHEDGLSYELLNDIDKSLKEHRSINKNIGDPFLCIKIDELYIKNSIIYNPSNMKIIGLCHDIDSDSFLSPTYDMIQQLLNDKDNDDASCDELIINKYSSKMILQSIIIDLSSKWSYAGPYWAVHKSSNAKHLYSFIIDDLIAPLKVEKKLTTRLLISDMSNPNLGFVLNLLNAKDCHELNQKKGSLSIRLPYYNHDEQLIFMFDPVHVLKNIRNYFSTSTQSNFNPQKKCYKLQDGTNMISWDLLIDILNTNVTGLYDVGRTISNKSLFLTAWTKQRVNLALDIFNVKVESVLESRTDSPNGNCVKSTLKFIRNVRKFLVGTFCNPIDNKNNIAISNSNHAIFDELRKSFTYFENLQNNNPNACLPIKTYTSICSIYYGFCDVWKLFYEEYKDPQDNGKLMEGVYLCPARMTQNELEKLFSKLRGMKCDAPDLYATGLANHRMQQSCQMNTPRTQRSNNSISEHRSFQTMSAIKQSNN